MREFCGIKISYAYITRSNKAKILALLFEKNINYIFLRYLRKMAIRYLYNLF